MKPFPIVLNIDEDFRLRTWITIKTRKIQAAVDTGATHSCINSSIVRELQVPVIPSDFSTLHLADQSKIFVEGSVNVWFVLNGVVYQHNFLVLRDTLDPIIIGTNFLHQTGTKLCIIPRSRHMGKNGMSTNNTPQISSLQVSPCEIDQENGASIQKVEAFLRTQLPRFDSIEGHSNVTEHVITMKHNRPLRQRYYPRNPAMQKVIDDQIDELITEDRIEPSKSPYSSPIVLARKKNNEWRLCVDYRQINENSIRDAYPIPQINAILEKLRNSKFFSTIDLRHGYW